MVRKLEYWGRTRFCPVCEKWFSHFNAYGVVPRPDACCPNCQSLERHRLIWLFLNRQTSLFTQGLVKPFLHVAPEPMISQKLRQQLKDNYLTADLFTTDVDVKMDIASIQYPDQSFGAIYCSHVLEYVPDHEKALGEFYRVLDPQGWAIIVEALVAQTTVEGPSIGAPGAVRKYGPDLAMFLENAGFSVQQIYANGFASQEEIALMGLRSFESFFFCRPQSPQRVN